MQTESDLNVPELSLVPITSLGVKDNFLKEKAEELDQKVEGILNQTQGTCIILYWLAA
jgi:hypothetical protein